MRVLAFSDVHLGAHGRTDDQEQVLYRIAALAIEERVDAVLFAGDMFEGPGVPSSHYLRVRRALCEPLAAAKIPVVAISGNGKHDSAGPQGEENALAVLQGQDFGAEAHGYMPSFAVHTRPAITYVPPGLVVACVPWASVNRLRAHLNGQAEDADLMAAQLVLRIMAGLRAEASRDYPGVPCYLTSHFACSGWKTPTGKFTDELKDVVLPLDELEALGFDAVLRGHVHVPGVVNGAGCGRPPVISLGSPGCLNHGEGSVPHGVWILGGEAPEFRPIEHRPFLTLDYTFWTEPEVFDCEDWHVGFGLSLPNVDGAIVRLRYECTAEQARRIDRSKLLKALHDAGAREVTVEATVERQTRARVEGMSLSLSPGEALDLYLSEQGINGRVGEGVTLWTQIALETAA